MNKDEEEIKFKRHFAIIERNGADKLLEFMEDKGFFEAPASTKYHGNYEGGLAEHSNHVFRRLVALAADEVAIEYEPETLAIVALLHDLCKMDAYKLITDAAKLFYTYTNAFPVGHGEKSCIQIMRFMPLTDEEILAIRWHMGGFDYSFKGGDYGMNNAFKTSRLAAMLHIADMMATHLDEREDKASE